MLSEKELKTILKSNNIRPNRLLGQNFLVDKNMQQKMLRTCSFRSDDIVLEIGPGLGALTFDMAKCANEVFSVEKDKMLVKILLDLAAERKNLKIVSGDILAFDIKEYFSDKKVKVVGNLPYYITNPILVYLLENRSFIDTIFITVQKELGRRLVAGPGSKEFGAISIYTQFYSQPRILFSIARGVFYPQPEVDSVFMQLDILKKPSVEVKSEELFFKVTRSAFSKRRKTILNAISSSDTLELKKNDVENLLKKAGVDPTSRAEQLCLQDFASIANSLSI